MIDGEGCLIPRDLLSRRYPRRNRVRILAARPEGAILTSSALWMCLGDGVASVVQELRNRQCCLSQREWGGCRPI
jgi:hypothetical protein